MNEVDLRILGLHEKINNTKQKIKGCKALAGLSLFVSICLCGGARSLGYVDPVANLVWIVSVIAIIVFYNLDKRAVKSIKAFEFRIYELEMEDFNDKKEIAEITGDILSNNLSSNTTEKPDEKVTLPTLYYGVLFGVDIIIRVVLLVNHIV